LQGTGEFINTKFFCRVCSMLHDPKFEKFPSHIEDVNDWWRGPGTCINGSWRKFDRALKSDEEKKKSAELQAAAQPNPAPPVTEAPKAVEPEKPQEQP
jgi:hypothetical protein